MGLVGLTMSPDYCSTESKSGEILQFLDEIPSKSTTGAENARDKPLIFGAKLDYGGICENAPTKYLFKR